jgi:hypothetical protein
MVSVYIFIMFMHVFMLFPVHNIYVTSVLGCSLKRVETYIYNILNIEFPVGVILMLQAGRISQNSSPAKDKKSGIEKRPNPVRNKT